MKHTSINYLRSRRYQCLCLSMSFCKYANDYYFIRRGTVNHIRFINIAKLIQTMGLQILDFLVDFHSFTGCNGVSAFADQGKLKALVV